MKWVAALWCAILLCLGRVAEAEEVTTTLNERTLVAELMTADGKGPESPWVLLTHDTLGHQRMEIIKTMQSRLTEAGFNTLAITLSLGLDKRQGMHECAMPHRHTHREALAELEAWMTWLKERGASRITLLGHGRGGNQSAWYAAEQNDPVIDKVVLVAPMTWNKGENIKQYRQRYGKELAPLLSQSRQLVAKGKGDVMLNKVDFLSCANASVSARTFADYYAHEPRFDTPLLFQRLVPPVLVIAGTRDTAVPDVARKVAPLADGQRVKLIMVDGADHHFQGAYGEALAAEISDDLLRAQNGKLP